MDLIKELEELSLATRLKRLQERLASDVSRIYKESHVDFEAKWFPVLELLRRHGDLSVVEISQALQLSHPAVVQFSEQLLKKGYITADRDPADARRRILNLSPGGVRVLEQLQPLLVVIRQENRKWLEEAGVPLLQEIEKLESALDRSSMYSRIREGLESKL
ncbi:MAG TPA: MarR family transcriptional regulator [Sphingobacteriaceae bacterium]